jgi:hypothetical protein
MRTKLARLVTLTGSVQAQTGLRTGHLGLLQPELCRQGSCVGSDIELQAEGSHGPGVANRS